VVRATGIKEVMAGFSAGFNTGSEFDGFLFATIGVDRSGMSVTVLSAMARSDLDPWQEAARLAELPGATAVESLTSSLGASPDWAWAHPEARAVATRLIALLPRRVTINVGSNQATPGLAALMKSRPWWIYVAFMSFMLGSQLIVSARMASPAVDPSHASAGNTVSPPLPPANPGQ
jgi:hypothetical protein